MDQALNFEHLEIFLLLRPQTKTTGQLLFWRENQRDEPMLYSVRRRISSPDD